MKKIFCVVISIVLVAAIVFPFSTLALTNDNPISDWEDAILSESEKDEILANGNSFTTNGDVRASDLIAAYSIGISKSGTNLYIVGETIGTAEVVKSGFKEVIIQRRTSSNTSWTDYITYEDLYIDQFAYNLAKVITVPSGYQYRVTCVHYAKKHIFSTQKLDNVSNTVTI